MKLLKKSQDRPANWIFLFLIVLFVFFVFGMAQATNSGTNLNASITIYDSTDLGSSKYTYCSAYNGEKGKSSYSYWDVMFFANFTNSSGASLNSSTDLCLVKFNETGSFTSWANMSYNSSSLLWEFNRSFVYHGLLNFSINCTSSYGNVTLFDGTNILWTRPYILHTPAGYIDSNMDGTQDTLYCTEDIPCWFNFSERVSIDDNNSILNFSYLLSTNTTLTNFSINLSSGVLLINVTHSNYTGIRKVELSVDDVTDFGNVQSAVLEINITAVNDAPTIPTLNNNTYMNSSDLFYRYLQIADEEWNIPFLINVTFVSCSVMEWSNRNCSNSSGIQLFNSSQYRINGTTGTINISFTPTRNDEGNYTINFTVVDSGTPNATFSQLYNFYVTVTNRFPWFQSVCNVALNATEDVPFICYINASDIDETTALILSANVSWFNFNVSGTSTESVPVNISTAFNATFVVQFTPGDVAVGNWSINLTVRDNGSPSRANSTFINFTVANANDSSNLLAISNMDAWTSNNYTFWVNATDDDLLIPDKRIYNENLTFRSSNNTALTFNRSFSIASTNIATASFYFSGAVLGAGTHNFNISVMDKNNYSYSYRLFSINVTDNVPPQWNASTNTNLSINEGQSFVMNLSKNVTDTDPLNFTNDSSFGRFFMNGSTGVVNFSTDDIEVGQHFVTISAYDGKVDSPIIFNFTVLNINDAPYLQRPLQGSNITVGGNSAMNTSEDATAKIYVWVEDNDLLIPEDQRIFYNESLNVTNLTIVGPNPGLFNYFSKSELASSNLTLFNTTFVPNKTDIGYYNVTLFIGDRSASTVNITFSLYIRETPHRPVLYLNSSYSSSIFGSIFLDANSTDVEDLGEGLPGSNLTYSIVSLTGGGGFLAINSTTGIINMSFNESHAGQWVYNVTVNDSAGLTASVLLTLGVYSYPVFISPDHSYVFNAVENVTSSYYFAVNHSVGDSLNYTLTVNGMVRNLTTASGNASFFTLSFSPNFTEETTCIGAINITLNASNGFVSNTTSWSLIINHTNSPLVIEDTINDIEAGTPIILHLRDYFSDLDASDGCNNQTVGFNVSLINSLYGTMGFVVSNWTNGSSPSVTFSSTGEAAGNYSVLADEYGIGENSSDILLTAMSNPFIVNVTQGVSNETEPEPEPEPETGGPSSNSGGGKIPLPSIKIIMPKPISVKRNESVIIPLTLHNNGQVALNDISLMSWAGFNNTLMPSLTTSFNIPYIPLLKVGEKVEVNLTAKVMVDKIGFYEISINASVKSPAVSDWGKFFLQVTEGATIEEKIVFTDELIASNPDCAEIKEISDEARVLLSSGQRDLAEKKIDEAIDGCKKLITQPPSYENPYSLSRVIIPQRIFSYVILASVGAFFIGILYYFYQRRRLQRSLEVVRERFNN